jgi:hypothetical protein
MKYACCDPSSSLTSILVEMAQKEAPCVATHRMLQFVGSAVVGMVNHCLSSGEVHHGTFSDVVIDIGAFIFLIVRNSRHRELRVDVRHDALQA